MIMRRIWPMLLAIIIFVLSVFGSGPVTEWAVTQFLIRPGTMDYVAGAQSPEVFQGTILQHQALKSQDMLPIYGSSEFSAWSDFHPSVLFAGKPTGFAPFLIGRGGCQSLVHVLNMASQGQALRNKKVVVVLSSQWFTPEGISTDYLTSNVSVLQTYRMLFNNQLALRTKQQIASRLLHFPVIKDYPVLAKLLKYYGHDDAKSRAIMLVYTPLGHLEMAAFELKDAVKSAKLLQPINVKAAMNQGNTTVTKELKPWSEFSAEATKAGQLAVTNNSFGIMDSYYLEYIEANLLKNKGSAQNAKLSYSPEYQDLELLLDVLKQTGAKPMFVIIPVSGLWSDYTGFPLVERQTYYQRVRQMVEQYGFPVADFSGHEYDPYFLKDIMHLGWKGWVKVDEAMDSFANQGS